MAAVEGELRHRKVAAADRDEASVADAGGRSEPEKKPESSLKDGKQLQPGTYWLTRIVFTRALGFIYFVAFLVALHQNKELLGENGLLPIPLYLSQLRQHFKEQFSLPTPHDTS